MSNRDAGHEEYVYGRNSAQFLYELSQGTRPILTVLGGYGRDWPQADRDRAIGALENLERRAKLLRERLAGYFSTAFRVVDESGRVELDTDDWVEAQRLTVGNPYNHVRGVHPTHTWPDGHQKDARDDSRCTVCGAWDNGSYGSQAPCGYDWQGRSLAAEIIRILEAREVAGDER